MVEKLDEIQQHNQRSKIAFSAAFRRNDSHGQNAKITQLNDLREEELLQKGFDMIKNSNILFFTLKKDGLDLNDGVCENLWGEPKYAYKVLLAGS